MSTPSKQSAADPCAVTRADVANLRAVHELLAALNDPAASAAALARCSECIPPLRARLVQKFADLYGTRGAPSLVERIARLGNRMFETILLEVLVDLTVLNASNE